MERLKRGEKDAGIANLEKAAESDPYSINPLMQLAGAYGLAHKTAQAQVAYRRALGLNPNLVAALNNLAWSLATTPDPSLRNGPEAVRLAQRACELTTNSQTVFIGTLAVACAEAGDFDQAIQKAETACKLASAHGEADLLKKNQELLIRYQNHQAYHEGE
jgi:Flp pilus assembly protein TadD